MLPTELAWHVGLLLDTAADLRAFCMTTHQLYALWHSRHFRTEWFCRHHPLFADLVPRNRPISCHIHPAAPPGQVLMDANALRLKLPLEPTWLRYWAVWFKAESNSTRQLPVLPQDASLRNACVIHAWRNVIHILLRNQVLPSALYDEPGERSYCIGETDPVTGKQWIGPDFLKLLTWFLDACAADEAYFAQLDGGQTDKVLPEGFINASRYAWLAHEFRPYWVDDMLSRAFHGIPEMWEMWIEHQGMEAKWLFNGSGLQAFCNDVKQIQL